MGYQFWWIPKIAKKERIKEAQQKQKEQRKMRLARIERETELTKQALTILEQVKTDGARERGQPVVWPVSPKEQRRANAVPNAVVMKKSSAPQGQLLKDSRHQTR